MESAAEEIFRQSEQLDREAIRAIPDGEYTAEGFLDSDGVGDDPVRIKVRISVEGERLVFDLTGTDGPGQGPINCGAVAGPCPPAAWPSNTCSTPTTPSTEAPSAPSR